VLMPSCWAISLWVSLQHAQYAVYSVFMQLGTESHCGVGAVWASYRRAVSRSACKVAAFAQGKQFIQFWMIIKVCGGYTLRYKYLPKRASSDDLLTKSTFI
jgi:hypothetical protein